MQTENRQGLHNTQPHVSAMVVTSLLSPSAKMFIAFLMETDLGPSLGEFCVLVKQKLLALKLCKLCVHLAHLLQVLVLGHLLSCVM